MKIIHLHRTSKPFAVLISNEITGKSYSILYKERYIQCAEMKRMEIRWFQDNIYLFRKTFTCHFGEVYEYKKFKKQMNTPLKHNFLVRNKIIAENFI